MRLSISNIAWEREHDPAMRDLLSELEVDAIDVAPGRYFSDPRNATLQEIEAVRHQWNDVGVEIVGMQALLFGTQGLNVFGDEASQDATLKHLEVVCGIGAALGARRLVFGSPKNRDASGWDPDTANRHAIGFFTRVADIAERRSVVVCLEPNPRKYNCNFMTTTSDAAEIVRAIGRPGIKLQFDTGAAHMNGEDAADELTRHGTLVGHVHASEPELAPLGSAEIDHSIYGRAIRDSLGDTLITIEMLPAPDRVKGARDAILFAQQGYRPDARN